MENYTKEQLWLLIGKYVYHVGNVEGADFLGEYHIPSKHLSEEDAMTIRQAADDFANTVK